MDWQKLVMDVVSLVFITLVTFSWKAYVKPFLEEYVKPWLIAHNLAEAARIAVGAAEAMLGRYHGEEKLKIALNQLAAKGWNIDSDVVVSAVKAEWESLNIKQIAAGVKEEKAEEAD